MGPVGLARTHDPSASVCAGVRYFRAVNKPVKQPAHIDHRDEVQWAGQRRDKGLSSQKLSHEQLLGAELDGRYRIVALQGRGGVGVVYKAMHLALDRPVAIKVLDASFAGDASMRQRFELEARMLSSLAHPHIVPLSDYGVAGGLPYLVMEFLDGESMDIRLARSGALPLPEVIGFGVQVLRALAFAHAHQVLHRDLKPGNVFIQRLGSAGVHVRLLDFGLGKFVRPQQANRKLTAAGVVMGTPGYMAPEQAAGEEIGAAADVYACGVLLYEMITGRIPFADRSQTDMLRAHLVEPVPAFKVIRPDLDVPPAIEAVVQRAMAKLPEERFRDGGAMLAAFEEAAGVTSLALAPTPPRGTGALSEIANAPTAMALSPTAAAGEHVSGVHPRPQAPHTAGDQTTGVSQAGGSRGAEASAGDGRRLWFGLLTGLVVLGLGAAAWFALGQSGLREGVPESEVGAASQETTPAQNAAAVAPDAADPAPSQGSDAVPGGAAGDNGSDDVQANLDAAAREGVVTGANAGIVAEEPRGLERVDERAASPTPLWEYGFESPSPEALAPFEARLESGGRLSRDELRRLRSVRLMHPKDPRPSLVLGHLFFAQSWYKDATQWYGAALETSGEALRDRRLVENLLVLATTPSAYRADAARLYAAHVGAQGLPLVDESINRHIDEPQRIRLLILLKERIEREALAASEAAVPADNNTPTK